jgi:hypothetical protein
MPYLKVLFQHVFGENEENYEKFSEDSQISYNLGT